MHQPKDIDWLSRWKHVHVCTSTYYITLLDPQNCMWLFYIVRLIMFPLWFAIVIIFYFWSDYWLWKLINIFYYCDYVSITHLIPLYHDWSTEKLYNSISPKLAFNRKICNHCLKSRCISELSWNFLKNTNTQVLLFSPNLCDSKEQSCLKTIQLYDDLLSSLFHFFYFVFSAPISFSLFSNFSLFFSQAFIKCSRKAFVYIYIVCIIYIF